MRQPDPSVPALLQAAFSHHQAGRLTNARGLYEQVLRLQPDSHDALSLLGLVVAAQGDVERGIQLVRRAIAFFPRFAEGRNYLAGLLLDVGRPGEALVNYDKAIALRPDFAEAFLGRGNALQGLDRHQEALASYDRAIALRPDHAQAYFNRGNVLLALGRSQMALASYDKAIAQRVGYAEAYSNRSIALNNLNRWAEALASADASIALRPGLAEAFINRGNALHSLLRDEEALACADRAIELRPGLVEAHVNRGNALFGLDRPADALMSFDKAIELRPHHIVAVNNRGAVLSSLNRSDEALASYETAIGLRSDDAAAHFGKGLCLLQRGDLPGGWGEHEWRWKIARGDEDGRAFREPLWLGAEALAGRTILLHAEQGFGDTLQFCRYVPLVAGRGARVVLEVPRPLARLLASLGGGAEIVVRGDPLPGFDLHCPLMSLPLAFGTTVETVPAPVPYLAADAGEAMAWRQRLATLPGRTVGLAWAGASRRHDPDAHAIDRRRSMSLRHLAPLADLPGVSFVSLQKGDAAAAPPGSAAELPLHDFTSELADFADTAALVAALDLVITVDTAVAHLAGALGRPVWILNRFDACWRWLLDREDSPWYPTARLFRQSSPGDWDGVVRQVRAALASFVSPGGR